MIALIGLAVATFTLVATVYLALRPVVIWEAQSEDLPLPGITYDNFYFPHPVVTTVSMRFAGRSDLHKGAYSGPSSGIILRAEGQETRVFTVDMSFEHENYNEPILQIVPNGYLFRPNHWPAGGRVRIQILSSAALVISVHIHSVRDIRLRPWHVRVSELRALPLQWERGLSAFLANGVIGAIFGLVSRLPSDSSDTGPFFSPGTTFSDKAAISVTILISFVAFGIGIYVMSRTVVRAILDRIAGSSTTIG